MNAWESLVNTIALNGPKFAPYGWFHWLWIGIIGMVTALLIIFARRCQPRTHRRILCSAWLVMLVLEIYKQMIFSVPTYDWNAFPFQFCSSPLYILPLATWLPNRRITSGLETFLGTFALMAGLIVLAVPHSVLNTTSVGVAIQTMVHHGLMVAIGIYLLVRNWQQLTLLNYGKAVLCFVVLVLLALIMNETLIYVTTDTVNLFYISRHFLHDVPIFSTLATSLPYPVYLSGYIVGFSLLALIIWGIARISLGIKHRCTRD